MRWSTAHLLNEAMRVSTRSRHFVVWMLSASALPAFCAHARTDSLALAFRTPPDAAKPRVWWQWMNGNVTKEGIRRDLEWMKRVGLGGVNVIDASIQTPQIVKQRLVYMSPAWKDLFRDAVRRADQLGLEL